MLKTSEDEKRIKDRHLEQQHNEIESMEFQLKMWKFVAGILLFLLVAAGWWLKTTLGKDDQSCAAGGVEELCVNFTANLSEKPKS